MTMPNVPIGQIRPYHHLYLLIPLTFTSDLEYQFETTRILTALTVDLAVDLQLVAAMTDSTGNPLARFLGAPDQLSAVQARFNTMFP